MDSTLKTFWTSRRRVYRRAALWAGITFAILAVKVALGLALPDLVADSLVLGWVPVVYALVRYGRRVGLACAGVLLGFSVALPVHPERLIEIVLTICVLAFLIGRLRDQAKASVVALWTVAQAKKHLQLIDLILAEWGYTDADTRLKQIRNLRSTHANYQMILEARLAGAEAGHEPRF